MKLISMITYARNRIVKLVRSALQYHFLHYNSSHDFFPPLTKGLRNVRFQFALSSGGAHQHHTLQWILWFSQQDLFYLCKFVNENNFTWGNRAPEKCWWPWQHFSISSFYPPFFHNKEQWQTNERRLPCGMHHFYYIHSCSECCSKVM